MATVKVLYFAQAREAAGKAQEAIHIGREPTARVLLDTLVAIHPDLGPFQASVRVAVNHEVVTLTAKLKDGDEVAVLPPIAGG